MSGPTWVGLLPPRTGWQERVRGDVAGVRASVDSAKHFFRERAEGVTDRGALEQIANDVWERTCLGEVPVRCAHAAESLGLMGPGDGVAIAYDTDSWLRLSVPGGSIATRRGLLPRLSVYRTPGSALALGEAYSPASSPHARAQMGDSRNVWSRCAGPRDDT